MPTTALHQYFNGETQAGYLVAAIGVASVCLAFYLLIVRSPLKAMAWPLIVLGIGEAAVGVGLVMRTGPQLAALEAGFHQEPQASAAGELQRIGRVNRSFRILIAAELCLVVSGAALAVFLRANSTAWAAAGLGLMLQASVMLVFDVFAEHRAGGYARWLSTVVGR
jgi:hypothetical protein